MDYQDEVLNLVDKSIFYAERAVIYLFWYAFIIFKLEQDTVVLILPSCFASTSLLTILAYCKIYGMDLRCYRRRFEVLYVMERIIALILFCYGGEGGTVDPLMCFLFFQLTTILYLNLAGLHADIIWDAYPWFMADSLLAARDRVRRGRFHGLRYLFKGRTDTRVVDSDGQASLAIGAQHSRCPSGDVMEKV